MAITKAYETDINRYYKWCTKSITIVNVMVVFLLSFGSPVCFLTWFNLNRIACVCVCVSTPLFNFIMCKRKRKVFKIHWLPFAGWFNGKTCGKSYRWRRNVYRYMLNTCELCAGIRARRIKSVISSFPLVQFCKIFFQLQFWNFSMLFKHCSTATFCLFVICWNEMGRMLKMQTSNNNKTDHWRLQAGDLNV